MNSDYQRILDKAQELYDMLETLANKWTSRGEADNAEELRRKQRQINVVLSMDASPESGWPLELPTIEPESDRLAEWRAPGFDYEESHD